MSSLNRSRRALLAFTLSVALALLASAVSVAFGGNVPHPGTSPSALLVPAPNRADCGAPAPGA